MFLIKLNTNLKNRKKRNLNAIDANLLKISPNLIQELLVAKKDSLQKHSLQG